MRMSGLPFALAAALAMVAVPAFTQAANPAALLSLSGDPSGGDSPRHGPGTATLVLGMVALAGVIGIAVAASHSDNKPASA